MAITKTNAMRILDAEKIPYSVHTYENKDGKIDGISVAGKIGKEIEVVYKTLVVKDAGSGIYVFVIPVEAELDLKKAAKVVNAKKLEMIAVKDIQKMTGYIRGGCSPIGMKKKYETILDASVNKQSSIIISGGKIGVQIEMAVEYLIQVTNAKVEEVIH
ncbi:Cys-tRNA(Pro) deacylase [Cytobacillus oceanisediminis]|uniref:Cys-tRNA(Pro)/Cys-tRNA(Cys) deacylase n=1 Tax=Niallia alba TaxID=2729105 RepID=A0A7Y0PPU4_9BACI|nr:MULTISPECIES: Cys-tRNA(Pro) deacylase [Bacillaceae]EOR24036.1 ybaK/ebsC protein [Niallia nealsonii AAU1]MBZ9535394.1 Cys-tRNA(Pro) deacylase [Cytobacillus oceanisediminis]NMO79786.1 Cys-tRNA(Pro) deacylase [Niallia alba]